MHSILWASLIASAGVAVVTTLLVEYLAKPSLEARKERILENKRDTRLTLNKLERIVFLSAKIDAWQRDKVDSPMRKRAKEDAVELEALATELIGKDVLKSLGTKIAVRENWVDSITTIGAHSIALQEKDLNNNESLAKFNKAYQKLDQFRYLLITPRWKYRKRRKIIREVIV